MGSVAYLEPVYSAAFARSNIIELNALSKNFGELKVLENIDFAIRKGEIFSIIGTSGSGKSTFLNIISVCRVLRCRAADLDFPSHAIL